ncbi:hypothetical protein D1AOALGA4SA_10138, partial [Olavius algarvensis Delta 1 endosymbiont]
GSFEPHRLYIKTERSVPATHANVQHRTSNNVFYLFKKTERSESIIRHSTFDIR